MKFTDLNLTRQSYNASAKNKGGIFNPPLGVIRNFGFDQQNITDAQLDQIFLMYGTSAFDDIVAFNPDRPLPRLQYNDLNDEIKSTLYNATILEINQLMKNGLMETTQTSTASTGSFTSNITPNTRIISSDQISQDVEDELGNIRYTEWQVIQNKDGSYTIYLEGQDLIIPKTKNDIALSAIILEGLDASDLTILGKQNIIRLIDSTASSSRAFRGTWNANNSEEIPNIDIIFNTTGLPLTDGDTTLTPTNTIKGDTILVTVSSNAEYLPEEVVYDGTNWVPITNNNVEKTDINSLKGELSKDLFKTTTGTFSINDMDFSNEDKQAPTIALMKAADAAIQTQTTKNANDISTNTQQINSEKTRNNEQQTQIDDNTSARQIFENERSSYARVEDLANTVTIVLDEPITSEGNDTYKINLSNNDLLALTTAKTSDIKLSNGSVTIFIQDSFNDGSSTDQTISLGGKTKNVSVLITQNDATITGDLGGEESDLLALKAVSISQLSQSINTGVDTTARSQASNAQITADQAQNIAAQNRDTITNQLTPAITKNSNDIAALPSLGNQIKYYKDQEILFKSIKTGTKFEDTSLFEKVVIPADATILGGSDNFLSDGTLTRHNHSQDQHSHKENWSMFLESDDADSVSTNNWSSAFTQKRLRFDGISNGPGLSGITSMKAPIVNSSGTDLKNRAYGIRIVSVVYIAKKDITFAEMGLV